MSSSSAFASADRPTPAATGSSRRAVSISLNGEARSVDAGLTVAGLLRQLALQSGMVVVERNREVLSRNALEHVPVEEGDQIEIVHFVGGG